MNPDAWLTGRRGQGLAVAIGVLLMALVWFGVVDPVWSWYQDRDLLLEQRQGLLRHMQDLAASLPSCVPHRRRSLASVKAWER